MRKNNSFKLILKGIIVFFLLFFILNRYIPTFPILFVLVISFIVYLWIKRTGNKKTIPVASKEKEEHYIKSGMSAPEIKFFRDTMSETKKQISTLEKNISMSSKLRAINLRYDTLKVAKGMFKEIVKEPKKLHLADKFLYTHLPNLVELTNKYIEIDQHDIKNKATYQVLNDSVVAIENMSQLILEDYTKFVSDDFDDIAVEIEIAKQNVKRTAESKKDSSDLS